MQLLSSASAALQKSDIELSLNASRRTFGAHPPSIPCTTARHNLATSFTRALLATRTHRNTQQLSPPCARERASKRALHPIHNVKQPENRDQRTDVRHLPHQPSSQKIFRLNRWK